MKQLVNFGSIILTTLSLYAATPTYAPIIINKSPVIDKTVVTNDSTNVSLAGNFRQDGCLFPLLTPTRLVIAGDSLSTTDYAPVGWVDYLEELLGDQADIVNVSVSGQVTTNIWTHYTEWIHPHAPSGGTNAILMLWCGVNDAGYGSTSIWAHSNIWYAARADGFKVVAFTITVKTNWTAAQRDCADRMNEQIRDSVLWDRCVDASAIAGPGSATSSNFVDHVHFTTNLNRALALEVYRVCSTPASVPLERGFDVGLEMSRYGFPIRVNTQAQLYGGVVASNTVSSRGTTAFTAPEGTFAAGFNGIYKVGLRGQDKAIGLSADSVLGWTTNAAGTSPPYDVSLSRRTNGVLQVNGNFEIFNSTGNDMAMTSSEVAANVQAITWSEAGLQQFSLIHDASGSWPNNVMRLETDATGDGVIDTTVLTVTQGGGLYFGGVVGATNGFQLLQLSAIPTNLIAASSASATNWSLVNIGGIPSLVATNYAAGGWLTKPLWP